MTILLIGMKVTERERVEFQQCVEQTTLGAENMTDKIIRQICRNQD